MAPKHRTISPFQEALFDSSAYYNDRRGHRQVNLKVGRLEEKVDEGIAVVLQALWRQGVRTEFSCQGDADELAYIDFPTSADLDQFRTMATRIVDSHWIFSEWNRDWDEQRFFRVKFPHGHLPELERRLARQAPR